MALEAKAEAAISEAEQRASKAACVAREAEDRAAQSASLATAYEDLSQSQVRLKNLNVSTYTVTI